MKMLLVTDTHGRNLDLISSYAAEMNAKLCIHAGDFGFYGENTVDALTKRELSLLIEHGNLPEEQKLAMRENTSTERLRAYVARNRLTGEFPEYLAGKKRFACPVCATWGNHDDAEVVLDMIRTPVPNLTVVHENAFLDLGELVLIGLGGNCLPWHTIVSSNGLLQKPFAASCKRGALPGSRVRPTSVLVQYARLIKTARSIPAGRHVVLVTHASPLVEPFLELVAWQTGAEVTVSGHMGRPDGETGTTDFSKLPELRRTYERLLELYPEEEETLRKFRPLECDRVVRHINLPDAEDGYGTLEYDAGDFSFEIRGAAWHTRGPSLVLTNAGHG